MRVASVVLLAVSLLSCRTPTPSVETFCDEAVPILSRNDISEDPATMRRQMEDLRETIDLLPEQTSAELATQVEELLIELGLAQRGQAVSGWSSADVVDTVAQLCGNPDTLMSWTVQP